MTDTASCAPAPATPLAGRIDRGDVKHALDILGLDGRDALEAVITRTEVRVQRIVRGVDGTVAVDRTTRLPRVVTERYEVTA